MRSLLQKYFISLFRLLWDKDQSHDLQSSNKNKTQRLLRWSLILQEYKRDIRHIKEKDNVNADYCSCEDIQVSSLPNTDNSYPMRFCKLGDGCGCGIRRTDTPTCLLEQWYRYIGSGITSFHRLVSLLLEVWCNNWDVVIWSVLFMLHAVSFFVFCYRCIYIISLSLLINHY